MRLKRIALCLFGAVGAYSFCLAQGQPPVSIAIEGQEPNRQPAASENADEGVTLMLERGYFIALPMPSQSWLNKEKIATKYIRRQELSDFYDGDFEFLGKLKDSLSSKELFSNDTLAQQRWQQIAETSRILPFPWRVAAGDARLVSSGGNHMVELSQSKAAYVDFGQSIVFKSTRANLSFEVSLVKGYQGGSLEVLVDDVQESGAVTVARYGLNDVSSRDGLSVSLSQNNDFAKLVRDKLGQPFYVFFRLSEAQTKEAVIRLDNIKITY